jgi:hypothetical protein
MKLINKKIIKILNKNKALLFIQIKKLDSYKLLNLKNKLLDQKMYFKFISNIGLKQFFLNVDNKTFLNFFQGDIIIICGKKLDCFSIYWLTNYISQNCFLYKQNRFFLVSNLIRKCYNSVFVNFLRRCLISCNFLKKLFYELRQYLFKKKFPQNFEYNKNEKI